MTEKTNTTPRNPTPAPAVLEALDALRAAAAADGLSLGATMFHSDTPLLAGEDREMTDGSVARYFPRCGAIGEEWTVCGPAPKGGE